MTGAQRFAISYGALRVLLAAVGLGPRRSGLVLTDDALQVKMGWAFRATIPYTSIGSAVIDEALATGIGVHGTRGHWLVNGAATGLIAISIEQPLKARVMGRSVRLSALRVSVGDHEAVLAALNSRITAA